jgi:hypothetical protein
MLVSAHMTGVLLYPGIALLVIAGVCVRTARLMADNAVYHGQIALIAFHFTFLSPA